MRFGFPGLVCISLVFAAWRANAATLVVASTNDSGPGSFRQALLDANATNGMDTIVFRIPGGGIHTLTPLTAFPAITSPVLIDGTSQPGYAGQPLIELNGSNVRDGAGLLLRAGGSTIRGLAINRFGGSGLQIEGAGNNRIQGNYLGTDPAGTAARGNGLEGVWLFNTAANLVGGAKPGEGNVISGNGDAGIYVLNGTGNVIVGNVVGTTPDGASVLGNANNGVTLYNSTSNRVGGADTGLRNVIAANRGSGVCLYGAGATGNFIQGNRIGTAAEGNLSLGNAGDGITLQKANGNLLGGSAAGEGNLVSGNGQGGISLSGASSNLIAGNLVGLTANGTAALGNAYAGVTLAASTNNLVGGASPGARNVISGNRKDGIFITSLSVSNIVAGNYIGLDATGTNAVPNSFNGLTINAAGRNTIGGAAAGSRNVISGNAMHGVQLASGGGGNVLAGNFIGTDASGDHPTANGLCGLRVESDGNLIGDLDGAARNVISGNSDFGVLLIGAGAQSNTVSGNYIGTTSDGSTPLGNGSAGVGIWGAPRNTIGGSSFAARNVLSANFDAGIHISEPAAEDNLILGNFIGVDVAGAAPLGNACEGIYIDGARGTLIAAGTTGSGNLVSANHTRGIFLTNAPGTVVQANLVGTAADGRSPLPNRFHNLELEAGATNSIIGGAGAAANVLAFAPAPYAGVRVRAGSRNNLLAANSIFGNGALGIDLGPAGVTPNDPCDNDTGANLLQNFPVLTQAVTGSDTGVRGNLPATARCIFRLQFFASPAPGTSETPQGQLYLGETWTTTDPNCAAAFLARLPVPAPPGFVLTATATDPANNTSEFSAAVPIVPLPLLELSLSNQTVCLAWSNSVQVVLRQTGSLIPPIAWTAVTNSPVLSGKRLLLSLPLAAENRFYTLVFE